MSVNSRGWHLRPDQAGILLDRCVGDTAARELIRVPKLRVLTLDDAYGAGAGEHVPDSQFLADAGRHHWMVWTQNPRMWHVPHEREAIEMHDTHVFCLASAQHLPVGKGFVFGRHFLSLRRRHGGGGPCFWRLYPGRPPIKDLR